MFAGVVVGSDGSPNSALAVAWATRESRVRQANLRVIDTTAWTDTHDDLIDATKAAALLVLAIRRSVARSASRTSPCPVVIMRGRARGAIRRIIVATDTSSAAVAGLELAAAEAVLHNAELVVIYVRDDQVDPLEAQCIVDLAVNDCRDRGASCVTGMVLEGDPATALAHASGDADLMVIGSRGRSGFKTLLFGSVAESLVDRALCPVLVTHPQPHTSRAA